MVAAEQGEYRRAIGGGAVVEFISSLDELLVWDNPGKMLESYNGVIFGGSGEFDFDGGRSQDDAARITSQAIVARVKKLVLWTIEHDFPLLGICYGHQIVSEALGVPVVNDHEQKKVGSFSVMVTEAGKHDPVFRHLPSEFPVQYGHKDSLSLLPPGATLLACSPLCKTSAVRFGKKVYTMQFHPELTKDDVLWKLSNSPGYLPEGIDVSTLVKPSEEASRIIPLFIEEVVE